MYKKKTPAKFTEMRSKLTFTKVMGYKLTPNQLDWYVHWKKIGASRKRGFPI